MSFNPSAPNTVGLEWPVAAEGATALDAPTKAHAFAIASTTAETITGLYVPHTWAGPGSGYGKLWCDLYPLSDAVANDQTTVKYAPNEQLANDGNWKREDWSTTTNVWQSIDDADDSVDPWADYIVNTNWGGEAVTRLCFASAAFPSTKRVLSVSFEIRALVPTWANGGAKLTVEHWYGSTKKATLGSITPTPNEEWATYTLGPFYLDANDDGPWSAASIIDFDGGSTKDNIALRALYTVKVSRVTMVVSYCTDKRVAYGGSAKQTVIPAGRQTGIPITLAANWSKASASSYLAVVRRLTDPNVGSPAATLTPSPLWLDSGSACPHGQGGIYRDVVLADDGSVTSVGSSSTRTAGFWLRTNAGAASADSQPYHDLAVQSAHASQTLYGDVVGATGGQSYKRVSFVVGVRSGAAPTASLTVALRRTSDSVQMGGTATLTVADLADTSKSVALGSVTTDGVTWSLYRVTLTLSSSATLAAATEYYFEWTTTTPSSNPWGIAWVDATASHGLTGDPTYGGSGVTAWVGGTSYEAATYVATFGSVPTALTGAAATAQTVALPNSNSMQFARVSWNASALGASFLRYELERSIDGGTTWVAVASIGTETDHDFDDYEGPSAVSRKYRVRVVRSDGATSDWAETGTVSLAMSSGLCVFTSNADPSITTGFWLLGDGIKVDFRLASAVVTADLAGRDLPVTFKPLTKRGFRWPFTVVVHADRTQAPAAGAGVRGWSPATKIAEANVPYICLKTFDGEVFYGSLTVSAGDRKEPGHLYLAEAVFTQTQADSSAVTV